MLLNSSFGILNSDPCDIIPKSQSSTHLSILTSFPTSLLDSIGSKSTQDETIISPNQPSKRIDSTLDPCLPWWVVDIFESTRSNVSNITSRR